MSYETHDMPKLRSPRQATSSTESHETHETHSAPRDPQRVMRSTASYEAQGSHEIDGKQAHGKLQGSRQVTRLTACYKAHDKLQGPRSDKIIKPTANYEARGATQALVEARSVGP